MTKRKTDCDQPNTLLYAMVSCASINLNQEMVQAVCWGVRPKSNLQTETEIGLLRSDGPQNLSAQFSLQPAKSRAWPRFPVQPTNLKHAKNVSIILIFIYYPHHPFPAFQLHSLKRLR